MKHTCQRYQISLDNFLQVSMLINTHLSFHRTAKCRDTIAGPKYGIIWNISRMIRQKLTKYIILTKIAQKMFTIKHWEKPGKIEQDIAKADNQVPLKRRVHIIKQKTNKT